MEMEIVVKTFDVSEFEDWEVDREIENLWNLWHPLIAAPMGFGFSEGEGKRELKIGRMHAAGGSLAEVVSSNPVWWTPTAKAEAVVGIVIALRFAHGLGLLHGNLNSGNVLFDGEGRIQIADFRPMRRGRGGGFSGEGEGDGAVWSPQADVSAFAMLLFEIVAGCSSPLPPLRAATADEDGDGDWEVIVPPDVPSFVSEIIEGGLRPIAGKELSFIAIIETLKANDFGIVAGVDSDEVSAFVSRVESGVQSTVRRL
jgi:serine/threonine protein kinase